MRREGPGRAIFQQGRKSEDRPPRPCRFSGTEILKSWTMPKHTTPEIRTPSHLAGDGKRFFEQVVKGYVLEPHHVETLTAACQQLMRAESARVIVDEQGVVAPDRFGALKENPACAVERAAALAAAKLIRQLGLDLPPPTTPRR